MGRDTAVHVLRAQSCGSEKHLGCNCALGEQLHRNECAAILDSAGVAFTEVLLLLQAKHRNQSPRDSCTAAKREPGVTTYRLHDEMPHRLFYAPFFNDSFVLAAAAPVIEEVINY